MRIIYNASLAIVLIDVLTKVPIKDAVILCNGKQSPYVAKDNGYYVFSNLDPGVYRIYIYATGYIKKEFDAIINFGETKRFFLELSFEAKNPKILNIPRIELSVFNGEKLVKNQDISIRLENMSTTIKLIHSINKGEEEMILNVPENRVFVLQRYMYSFFKKDQQELDKKIKAMEKKKKEDEEKAKNKDRKKSDDSDEEDLDDFDDDPNDEDSGDLDEFDNDESDQKDGKTLKDKNYDNSLSKEDESKNFKNNKKDKKNTESGDESSGKIDLPIMTLGYDQQFNAYILDKPVENNIPIGGMFKPYWNLMTDSEGKLIIPFIVEFMNSSTLNFSISFNNKIKDIKINPNSIDSEDKTISKKIKFLND